MRTFRLLATLISALALTACDVGSTGGPTGGSPDAGAPMVDADLTGASEISGAISDNAAWGGTVVMTDETIIESGVTVSIAPGTVFQGAQGAVLRVHGTLEVNGSETEKVTMNPVASAGGWGGIVVESGGKVTLTHATGAKVATLVNCKSGAVSCDISYADFRELGKAINAAAPATIDMSVFQEMSSGGVSVTAGGDLTITESYFWTSTHDLIVQTGGKLTLDHIEIGGAQTTYEHCDIHIGSAESLTITNSRIVSAIYGMMLGGTTNAVIQYNDFVDNDPNQDVSPTGPNSNADLRFNYWDDGAPDLGADYDTSSPSATPIAGAGPSWALPQ